MVNDLFRNKLTRFVDNKKSTANSFVDYAIDKGSSIIANKLIERYSYRMMVNGPELNIRLVKYLLQFNPKLEKKLVNGFLAPDSYSMTCVDVNTFIICVNGNPLLNSQERYIINRVYSNNEGSMTTNVYIIGKYAKKVYKELKEITALNNNKGLVIYNVSSSPSRGEEDGRESFQSIITDLNERNIDTLFYKDDIKEEIISHIDSFFKNKEIYEKRNINFKTGILLYGEPGTGKSSLANALASKYGLNIVLININTFDKLDVQTTTSCFNADDKTYICLLEDIDTLYNINRDSENNIDKDDKKVINKLLQFLDSNSSPNNVIFIATTNYVEKLDEALLREGRFGKKFYIGPITEVEAVKMCKSFDCTDEMIEHIMSKIEDKSKINQSKLQGLILDEFKVKETE